jgi:hypothetical protein
MYGGKTVILKLKKLGATVEYLTARATRRPGFAHPSIKKMETR